MTRQASVCELRRSVAGFSRSYMAARTAHSVAPLRCINTVYVDFTGVKASKHPQDMQQGCFSAAAGPGERTDCSWSCDGPGGRSDQPLMTGAVPASERITQVVPHGLKY